MKTEEQLVERIGYLETSIDNMTASIDYETRKTELDWGEYASKKEILQAKSKITAWKNELRFIKQALKYLYL